MRRPSRLLIVEDTELNRIVFERLLAPEGFDVCFATNGAEGVDMVVSDEFDLILMDLAMPVMDGLEATRRIRALDDLKRCLPIIAVTAHDTPDDREQCESAGMDGFLPKPVRRGELLSAIDAAWTQHQNQKSDR